MQMQGACSSAPANMDCMIPISQSLPSVQFQSNDQRLFLPPQKGYHLRSALRSQTPTALAVAGSTDFIAPLSVSTRQMCSLGLPEEERRGAGGGRPPPNSTCYTHARTHAGSRSPLLSAVRRSLARSVGAAVVQRSPQREGEREERKEESSTHETSLALSSSRPARPHSTQPPHRGRTYCSG